MYGLNGKNFETFSESAPNLYLSGAQWLSVEEHSAPWVGKGTWDFFQSKSKQQQV